MHLSNNETVYMISPVILLIVSSNSMVLIAFLYDRKLRILRNTFLISLAVADIMVGAVSLPVYTASIYYPRNTTICSAFVATMVVFMAASLMNIVAVSIERWVAIFKPYKYRRLLTPRNVLISIIVVWILAIASGISSVEYNYVRLESYCSFTNSLTKTTALVLCSLYFIICLVMGYMQIRVFYVVRHHRNKIYPSRTRDRMSSTTSVGTVTNSSASFSVTTDYNSSADQSYSKKRTRLLSVSSYAKTVPGNGGTRKPAMSKNRVRFHRQEARTFTMNIIYMAFIFMWTPQTVLILLGAIGNCDTCRSLFVIFGTIATFNSAINPTIYALRLREFRRALRRMFCGKRDTVQTVNVSSSRRPSTVVNSHYSSADS